MYICINNFQAFYVCAFGEPLPELAGNEDARRGREEEN